MLEKVVRLSKMFDKFELLFGCNKNAHSHSKSAHTQPHRGIKWEASLPKVKFQQLFTGDWCRLCRQLVDTLDWAEKTDSPILPRHCDR